MKHLGFAGSFLFLQLAICGAFPTFAQDIASPLKPPRHSHSRRIPAKDDIEAIGTRDLGGSRLGDWYSWEREVKLGKEYAKAVDNTSQLETDAVVIDYVNRIGQTLVRNSDARIPFTIKVIEADDINAFAFPGGFLYVNTGLILAAQDEAELAAVIAHEIAHVAARHGTRELTRSQMFKLASFPLVLIGGPVGLAVQEAVQVVSPLSMMKFSRGFEAEADYLGVEYLYKAGYDPRALISFLERLRAMKYQNQGTFSRPFADHPEVATRIKRTEKEIARILPPRDIYVISSSDFEQIQSRLINLESRREMQSRPTLKRRLANNDTQEQR